MVFTLFCFLKDSASMSQVLLDDFKASQVETEPLATLTPKGPRICLYA